VDFKKTNSSCELYWSDGLPSDAASATYSTVAITTIFHSSQLYTLQKCFRSLSPYSPDKATMLAIHAPTYQALKGQISQMPVSRFIVAALTADYGPLSRVVAVDLCFPTSVSTIFVSVDDDVVYNRHALLDELPAALGVLSARLRLPRLPLVGYAGWGGALSSSPAGSCCFPPAAINDKHFLSKTVWPNESQFSLPGSHLSRVSAVPILEQYGGVAFHRNSVTSSLYREHLRADFPRACFYADDLWLATYAVREGRPRFAVRGASETQPSIVGLSSKPAASQLEMSRRKVGLHGHASNYRDCLEWINSSSLVLAGHGF